MALPEIGLFNLGYWETPNTSLYRANRPSYLEYNLLLSGYSDSEPEFIHGDMTGIVYHTIPPASTMDWNYIKEKFEPYDYVAFIGAETKISEENLTDSLPDLEEDELPQITIISEMIKYGGTNGNCTEVKGSIPANLYTLYASQIPLGVVLVPVQIMLELEVKLCPYPLINTMVLKEVMVKKRYFKRSKYPLAKDVEFDSQSYNNGKFILNRELFHWISQQKEIAQRSYGFPTLKYPRKGFRYL